MLKFGSHLSLAGLHVGQLLVQRTGFPTHDGVLAGLGEDKLAEPAAAVDVVSVYVSGGEVGEVAELGLKRLLGLEAMFVRLFHGAPETLRVDLPQL